MADDDNDQKAFVMPIGLSQFNVLPFGLLKAPATFHKMIDCFRPGCRWKICLCYLDDIVVHPITFSTLYSHLQLILSCLLLAGLELIRKKFHFSYEEIKELGYAVSARGISPEPDRIKAVLFLRSLMLSVES